MHCISDPCETNCSRCSSHWLGAFRAHTVRISSIIAYLSLIGATPSLHQDKCGILNGSPQLCDWVRVGLTPARGKMASNGRRAMERKLSRSALGKEHKV